MSLLGLVVKACLLFFVKAIIKKILLSSDDDDDYDKTHQPNLKFAFQKGSFVNTCNRILLLFFTSCILGKMWWS